jgi:SM-20-related protein
VAEPLRLSDDEIVALGKGSAIVCDAVLGPLADPIRRAVQALPNLKPAGVGRGADHRLDQRIRGDEIAWLPDQDELRPLRDLFESVRVALNEGAYLGLVRTEIQVARYAPGTLYERHRDAFAGPAQRRATAIWYANEGWTAEDGGALRIFGPEGTREVLPALDRLVVFLADRLEHEVLPARRDRWAVTAWFRGREDVPL